MSRFICIILFTTLCILCAHRTPAAPVYYRDAEGELFDEVTDFQRDVLNLMKLSLGSFDREHQLIFTAMVKLQEKLSILEEVQHLVQNLPSNLFPYELETIMSKPNTSNSVKATSLAKMFENIEKF